MTGLKLASVIGIPVAAGFATIELVALSLNAAGMPSGEIIGSGATGGAVVGAVAWALYKAKVDQHTEELKKKADQDAVIALDKRLDELHKDVREIRDALRVR